MRNKIEFTVVPSFQAVPAQSTFPIVAASSRASNWTLVAKPDGFGVLVPQPILYGPPAGNAAVRGLLTPRKFDNSAQWIEYFRKRQNTEAIKAQMSQKVGLILPKSAVLTQYVNNKNFKFKVVRVSKEQICFTVYI